MPIPSHPASRLALAVAAMLAATGAHAAESSATVHVAQWTYQLIDMDLSDGIAPSINFIETIDRSRSSFARPDHTGQYIEEEADALETQGSTGVSRPFGSASTRIDAASVTASTELTAEPLSPAMFARAAKGLFFQLSPSTRVIFGINGTLDAASGDHSQSAATVGLAGNMSSYDGGVPYQFYEFSVYRTVHDDSLAFDLTGALQSSTSSLWGRVDIHTYADTALYSGAPTSPVPEPAGYAMLLLGAGVIGAAARRRTSARAGSPAVPGNSA